jgi:hypothetical protein
MNAMKTNQIAKLFLMSALAGILVTSCSKTELATNYGNLPASTTLPEATLTDFGPLNDTLRHMQAVVSNQDYTISSVNGELPGSGAQISLSFFSGVDGGLQDGVYNYTKSTVTTPFTFGNALLFASDGSDSGPHLLDVANGTIMVTRTGSTYGLQFDFNLTNGDSFSSSYSGQVSYSDQY